MRDWKLVSDQTYHLIVTNLIIVTRDFPAFSDNSINFIALKILAIVNN